MTRRQTFASFFVVSSTFVLLSSGAASGQGMAGSMPLPLAVDLKKVPVGSWSEYNVTSGAMPMTIRMALVGRSAKGAEIETQMKGGPISALGLTTVRMLLPLQTAAEIKPKEQVMQIGDNPPMLLPLDLAGPRAQSFKRLDPKGRIGVDNVVVPSGSFPRADHHQIKDSTGTAVDFWISKNVLPFGLIKMTTTAPAAEGAAPNTVAMELVAQGVGAKPVITGTPRPFDPATLMQQAQPAKSSQPPMPGVTSPGAGPPPRPIPSPHPGMPPTAPGATPPPGSKGTNKTTK